MFFPKGKIKHGSEYKRMGHMNRESHFDTGISHPVALLLVKHFAQCCTGLAVCATICECVSRNRSGLQKPQGFCSFKKTCGTRAEHVLCQVLSTNVVHTWMLFSYPFEKLRLSTVIICSSVIIIEYCNYYML